MHGMKDVKLALCCLHHRKLLFAVLFAGCHILLLLIRVLVSSIQSVSLLRQYFGGKKGGREMGGVCVT